MLFLINIRNILLINLICFQFNLVYSENNFVKISQSDLKHEELLGEKIRIAANYGFFYLEIPDECKMFIDPAKDFADSFYKDESLKTLQLKDFSGYHNRENTQVEAFYLEREYWEELLPEQLFIFASKVHCLGVDVLKRILSICEISENDYASISGNVSEGDGDIFFTFNHYDSTSPFEGLGKHRDFGQFTILFTEDPGLEVLIKDEWVSINPIPGYFIVNFGKALEKSINDSEQLIAAWHRVRKMDADRISFAICAGNSKNSYIYQKTKEGEIINTEVPYLKILQTSKRYKPSSES